MKFKGKEINTEGSILSQIYIHYESIVMNKFYEKYKNIIVLPLFDGCIVNQEIPIEELNELSKEYNLKWCLKPITSIIPFTPITNELSIRNYQFMKNKFEKEFHYIQTQCVFINEDVEFSETHLKSALTNWKCWCSIEQKYVSFFKLWLKILTEKIIKILFLNLFLKKQRQSP